MNLKKDILSYKEFHPDKYANATDQEKRLSLQITSYINEAYNTLKDDYLKSLYLLKITGYEIGDQKNSTISDPEFLMHQMELREESEKIANHENSKEFEKFSTKVNDLKVNCIQKFNENFEKKMYDSAASKIKEMKFYISIENDFNKEIL